MSAKVDQKAKQYWLVSGGGQARFKAAVRILSFVEGSRTQVNVQVLNVKECGAAARVSRRDELQVAFKDLTPK